MTKPKTLDQLRAEKERAETQLAQEQHKLERLENRKKYLEKGERTKRTHRLCNLGGTIESLAPEVKDLTRTEMTELMEHIFSLSEVQRAVRHMAITHISQHRPQRSTCPCTTEQPTEQFNIFAKAEVSTRNWLRLFFFPGIFTRTQSGTMLCLSAETETAHRDTPMCEERQTHSDRILPGLTSPIRSAMRATATSSLSLKRQ